MHGQVRASNRTQVLFVHNSREYGGAEKHLIDLLHALAGPGIELSILCLDADLFSDRLSRNDSVPVDIKRRAGLGSFRAWLQLFRQLRPDAVVFVNGVLWSFPRYTPIAAWLAGIRRH